MKRHDKEEMQQHYRAWLASGKSKAVFASEQGLLPTTFHYWIKKFEREESVSPPAGFSRIHVRGSIPPVGEQVAARIHYPSGMAVDLLGPLDAALLRALVQ
jgi:transposase-like protein